MKRIILALSACFLILIFTNGTVQPKIKNKVFVFDYENVLGTSYEIKVLTNRSEIAKNAENLAMAEIDRLNLILSGYDSKSEFSRWSMGPKTPVLVSPELFEVLGLFDNWKSRTHGALDASAEKIVKLWKAAGQKNKEPSAEELAEAVKAVQGDHWRLDPVAHTALRLDDVPIRLNSFAKSYIIEKACEKVMKVEGVSGVVMNIGGDIVVMGNHTEPINIANPKSDAENDAPLSRVKVFQGAIATSGNYRRGELINGVWHSHIVDPRNGMPSDQILSATVIAPKASDAGALATSFNVLSPDQSRELASQIPGVEYLIITREGKRFESQGWKSRELELPELKKENKSNALAGDKTWDPKYELVLNLELAEIEGIRVHRPFVAVWLVDKNKKPVRNIALWYNKPKYLHDMHAWYDAYYNQFSEANNPISSTTSATRSPGKYKIKWDGKDDKGEWVKLGTYTLMVEVAREHGTYQLMSQEFDFTKKIKPVTLSPNTEVSSASIEYSKKAESE